MVFPFCLLLMVVRESRPDSSGRPGLGGRESIQAILNILNPICDVIAEMINHLLILFFPLRVFSQHAEEKVDVQRCPNALLQRCLDDGLNGRWFHTFTSLPPGAADLPLLIPSAGQGA